MTTRQVIERFVAELISELTIQQSQRLAKYSPNKGYLASEQESGDYSYSYII